MSDVVPEFYYGSLWLTDYPYAIGRDDSSLDVGSPEKVMEVIQTLLTNGDITLSSGEGNRTLTIPVYVMGATLMEVARNEAALQLECDRDFNELTLIPGDGWAAPTVFQTYAASATCDRTDSFEAALLRRWDLVIPAAPFVRSVDKVSTTGVAQPAVPVTTSINDCSSATGWSPSGSVSSSGGSVSYSTIGFGGGAQTVALELAVSGSWGSTPLMWVDWNATRPNRTDVSFYAKADGVVLSQVAALASPDNPGFTRIYFSLPPSVTSSLRFEFSVSSSTGGPTTSGVALFITQVSRTNAPPGGLTRRQQIMTLDVVGSAPTEGSIHLNHPTDALGDVMVYTCAPDNPRYTPDLRKYLVSAGTPTSDSTLVSGTRNPLSVGWIADIPAINLPAGSYAIWARLRSSGTGAKALAWDTSQRFGTSNTIAGSTVHGDQTVTFPVANEWRLYPIGRVMLPAVTVPNSSASTVSVTLSSVAGVDIDEAWLFNRTTGALSVMSGAALPGTSPPTACNVWIDTASIETPMPTVWRGQASDRSDAYGAGAYVMAWGVHELDPGQRSAFVVTTGAQDVTVTVEHWPKWHTNAAQ